MAAIASATIVAPLDARRLGHEHQAVCEHGLGEPLHVVRERVVAALDERARLGGAQQHQAGARRGAELDAAVGARVAHQGDDVVAQRARRVHAVRGLDGLEDLGAVGDGLEVEHAVARLVAGEHPASSSAFG